MALSPATLPLGGSPPGVPGGSPSHREPPPAAPERQRGASLQIAHSMTLPGKQGRDIPLVWQKCTLSNGSATSTRDLLVQ